MITLNFLKICYVSCLWGWNGRGIQNNRFHSFNSLELVHASVPFLDNEVASVRGNDFGGI